MRASIRRLRVALIGFSGCELFEHRGKLWMPVLSGPDDRSFSPDGSRVHVRGVAEERLHHLHVPRPSCLVKGSFSPAVSHIRFRAVAEEKPHQLHLPLPNSALKRPTPFHLRIIRVPPVLDQT